MNRQSTGEGVDLEYSGVTESVENRPAEIDLFDFRRADRIPKSQLRGIYLLHENFVRSLSASLSAYLRTYLSMNLIGVEQISYAKFLERLPANTCMTFLGLKPYDGHAVLEINPSLVFPILELLLGASKASHQPLHRELTEIEHTLMDGLFRVMVKDLSEAWIGVSPIEFSIVAGKSEPQLLRIMSANEALVAVTIDVQIGESSGHINLAMPSLMVKMVRQKLESHEPAGKSESTPDEKSRLFQLVKQARVEIDARVLDQQIRTDDLLGLQVGDVIAIDIPVGSNLCLALNGKPHFRGQVVRMGQKRGFQITASQDA